MEPAIGKNIVSTWRLWLPLVYMLFGLAPTSLLAQSALATPSHIDTSGSLQTAQAETRPSSSKDTQDTFPESQVLRIESRQPLTKILFRDLTSTEFKRAWKFAVSPKFEDIFDEKNFRIDFELRYGVTSNWQVGADLRLVIDTDFRDNDRTAFSRLRLLTKYRWKQLLWNFIEVASGIKLDIPLTDDPSVGDGIFHAFPWSTFLHVREQWPNTIVYVHTGVDIFFDDVSKEDIEQTDNEVNTTFWRLAPGIVFPRPPLYYLFDIQWDTNFDLHSLIVTPGIRWDVPQARWLPGLWTLEFGLRFGFAETDKEVTASARIKVDFGAKRRKKKKSALWYLPLHHQAFNRPTTTF